MSDLVIRGKQIVFSDGVRPASLRVRKGRIDQIAAFEDVPSGSPLVDADDDFILPGLVDTHVHVNEPGRTEWEGFATATSAAAAGGVTTILDMPLNSIPSTVSPQALQEKAAAADGQCRVDVGFIGGVVPGNDAELKPLWKAGVVAFKCFLVDSGVPEFQAVGEADLRSALQRLRKFPALLMAHAELPEPMAAAQRRLYSLPPQQRRRYPEYLLSRPDASELEAIQLLIRLCREFRSPVHVVHLSSAAALEPLERAKNDGLPITVETCPHYLCFSAEEIPDGATQYKCAPPIRSAENRERLWEGLKRGVIDMIVSDHSPSPPQLKSLDSGDFSKAWGGVASLQLGLQAIWTEARERGIGIEKVVEWMCHTPAQIAGLRGRKGEISAGADADLVVFNSQASQPVSETTLQHRHKITPYLGRVLHGRVSKTFLLGQNVFDGGRFNKNLVGNLLFRA